MGKARLPPPRFEELAVERREQPGFHFGGIAQLVAFHGPNGKSLLRQITGVGLGAREAESELIQRRVKTRHEAFKIQGIGHTESSIVGSRSSTFVPGKDEIELNI